MPVSGPIVARDVEPENVDWLWRERIPRAMMTFVAGRPDQGKGLCCVHIAADVSNGAETGIPENVLYSAIEDSHGLMTRPRLEAAGANLENVYLWRFQLPGQMKEMETVIERKQLALVVIDPVAAHLNHGVSRHSDSIRQVLNPLQEIAERTGVSFLFVDHALKRVRQGGHPLDAVGGSGSGLPAACRMGYVFGTDPSDGDCRYLCAVKSNLREMPKAVRFEVDVNDTEMVANVPSLIVNDDDADFDPMRLFETRKGNVGRPPDRRSQAAEWLSRYLFEAGGPVPAGKVIEDAKHYGMTQKTLRRAADDMEIVRNPPGGGRNCTWDLPQEVKDLLDPPKKTEQPKVPEEELEQLAHSGDEDLPPEADTVPDGANVDTFDLDDELTALLGDTPPPLPEGEDG
jgi:hypothetical protein